jgi:hypothetical protein
MLSVIFCSVLLCWLLFMLNSSMLSTVYAECHIWSVLLCWLLFMLSNFMLSTVYAECHILLSAVMLVVIYAKQFHAEYCLC